MLFKLLVLRDFVAIVAMPRRSHLRVLTLIRLQGKLVTPLIQQHLLNNYTNYRDDLGRRKTSVVAIDALVGFLFFNETTHTRIPLTSLLLHKSILVPHRRNACNSTKKKTY